MELSERSLLLQENPNSQNSGLSSIFAIICIVDVFGVFPIISLPKTVIDCGYSGIILIAIVCCAQIYTAILLGKCWIMAEEIESSIQFKNRYPYAALAELTYGKCLSKIVTVLLDLTVFGGGIPNLIVASQTLQFLGLQLTGGSFNVSFCYWMVLMGIVMCPFLWFGSPKDMKLLCTISASLVVFVFVIVFLCIITDGEDSMNDTPDNRQYDLWQNVLIAYGIITFQFDIHPTVLTIQVDMQNKLNIVKTVIRGFSVTLLLFFVTCISMYVRYGSNVKPSILEMLPGTVFSHFGSVLVATQLALSSAISNSALYQHIEDSLNIPREFNIRRCAVRSVLAILSIIVAESVPRFDLVMSLIGGALTGPLVFILPSLFYIKMIALKRLHEENLQIENFQNLIYSKDDPVSNNTDFYLTPDDNDHDVLAAKLVNNNLQISLNYLIILLGISATIGTVYCNVSKAIQYVTFSPPCIIDIYNITFTSN